MKWYIDRLLSEGEILVTIPITMALIISLSLILGYLINRWIYKETLSNLKDLIDILKARIEQSNMYLNKTFRNFDF